MIKRTAEDWQKYREATIAAAEAWGFTVLDVDRVYSRLGRYPTLREIESAAGRMVARILMEGHSDERG